MAEAGWHHTKTAPTTDESFVPDPAEAKKLITERTRAIVLVTPGNPTGVTIAPATIQAFFELAQEHDIALIVDETYRNFRPSQEAPHPLYNQPAWEETAIFLHSFSKDLAIPGYRVGAIGGWSFLPSRSNEAAGLCANQPSTNQPGSRCSRTHQVRRLANGAGRQDSRTIGTVPVGHGQSSRWL